MNSVIISLLKGGNRDKLALLNEKLSLNNLMKLITTEEIKRSFNLVKGYAYQRLEEIITVVEKLKIKPVTINEESYPSKLKDIFDPPFLLYVRGNLEALDSDLVSVVGTRKPSLRGQHEAFKLGMDLGRESVGVVSGLALGIDTAAHYGNVLTGGKTVAVLGSGVETIYPKSNKALAGEILKCNGAIISEFPPGDAPKAYNFPKRNRIIAGLSRNLVIIQAPTRSGSLITGDFALNNGGDVFVHSVGVNDIRFLGSDKYYKEGANKIDSAYPVLSNIGKKSISMDFDPSDYSLVELTNLELSNQVVQYKGRYFKL